jgi:serine/threonine protein kinase
MGVVWLAEDKTIGRQVAIKELLLPAGIAPQERHVFEERVLREARTAGRLSDPGIVTVHDVVQEDGATFIVMELIEAPNLSEVIRQHGAMPPDRVLKVAEQVLLALQTAHAAGIVHRDVKPSNVMVGANGRVKLTDFGIAQSTEDPRLTTSGTLIGSPTYISPERLLGRDASPASDLWALGATLFFALEGYGAYDRSTTAASIQAIMNERVQLRMVPHGPLADLIMGLLNPAPEARLTAPQAHQLIDHARGQLPPTGPQQVLQPPPPMPQPPSSGPQRVLPPPPNGGTHVLPSSKKGKKGIMIAAAAVVLAGAVAAVLAVTGVFDSAKDSSTSVGSSSSGPAGSATKKTPKKSSSHSGNTGAPASPGSAAASGNTHYSTKPLTYGPGGNMTSQEFVDNAGVGCFAGNNAAAIHETSCADPHDIEVYATVDLEIGYGTYPPMDAMSTTATDGCKAKFSALTPPYEVIQGVMVPSKDAWTSNKRKGLCVAFALGSGRMSGSIADN